MLIKESSPRFKIRKNGSYCRIAGMGARIFLL